MHRYGLANAGATIIDLKSGTFAGFGENRPLSPASVIKVPLMVEVMKQVEGWASPDFVDSESSGGADRPGSLGLVL
jgi:hypothetical protein